MQDSGDIKGIVRSWTVNSRNHKTDYPREIMSVENETLVLPFLYEKVNKFTLEFFETTIDKMHILANCLNLIKKFDNNSIAIEKLPAGFY